jgi:hypothetical protein
MRYHWFGVGIAVVCLAAFLAVDGFANEEAQGKGKGGKGDQKSGIVEIDLSKLPPDLAKQLQKFAGKGEKGKGEKGKGEKGKGEMMAKGKGKGESAKTALRLPPGLAKKPVDHPGRVAWIKAHSGAGSKPAPTKKGGAAPKKGEDMKSADLDRRIERLLSEIEELRREVRGKKK